MKREEVEDTKGRGCHADSTRNQRSQEMNEVKGADRGGGCRRIGRGIAFSGITEKEASIASNGTGGASRQRGGKLESDHTQ